MRALLALPADVGTAATTTSCAAAATSNLRGAGETGVHACKTWRRCKGLAPACAPWLGWACFSSPTSSPTLILGAYRLGDATYVTGVQYRARAQHRRGLLLLADAGAGSAGCSPAFGLVVALHRLAAARTQGKAVRLLAVQHPGRGHRQWWIACSMAMWWIFSTFTYRGWHLCVDVMTAPSAWARPLILDELLRVRRGAAEGYVASKQPQLGGFAGFAAGDRLVLAPGTASAWCRTWPHQEF